MKEKRGYLRNYFYFYGKNQHNPKMKNVFKSVERVFSRIKQRRVTSLVLGRYGQQSVVDSYQTYTFSSGPIGTTSPIWVCWWQGEAAMPEVVRACYRSILAHSCSHPVVLLTSSNQDEYLHLPEWVCRKYREGKISPTHFSDIARMYLLKEYGGIWMDITNFLTQDVDSFVDVSLPYWTCRHVTPYNNVSCGLWTSYFSASCKHHLIPSYIYDSLLHWWSGNDDIIDYLLMDYIFKIGYDHLPSMRAAIVRLPLSPIGMLRKALCRKYDVSEWEFYCCQAGFHKLSYKKYTEKLTSKGEKTHYAHLLETWGQV